MGLFLDLTKPTIFGICAPYAPLRAHTPAIRTLSVFVGSVAMDFAPKLAKIGPVGVENYQLTFRFLILGAIILWRALFSIL